MFTGTSCLSRIMMFAIAQQEYKAPVAIKNQPAALAVYAN